MLGRLLSGFGGWGWQWGRMGIVMGMGRWKWRSVWGIMEKLVSGISLSHKK